MKKLTTLLFAAALLFVVACEGGSDDPKPVVNTKVTGVVAKGSPLPIGSTVEIRGAASGPTTPSIVITTTISNNSGSYEGIVNELTAPYLVRAYDAAKSVWLYSYTTGTVANINTFTDALVRDWYGNTDDVNQARSSIDASFLKGTYSAGDVYSHNGVSDPSINMEGRAIPMPDATTMNKAKYLLEQWLYSYHAGAEAAPDTNAFGDIFVSPWTIGVGWDAVLDSLGAVSGDLGLMQVVAMTTMSKINAVKSYYAYIKNNGGFYSIEHSVRTTGSAVTVQAIDGSFAPRVMSLVSTTNGVNHFADSVDITAYYNSHGGSGPSITQIIIDGAPAYNLVVVDKN